MCVWVYIQIQLSNISESTYSRIFPAGHVYVYKPKDENNNSADNEIQFSYLLFTLILGERALLV